MGYIRHDRVKNSSKNLTSGCAAAIMRQIIYLEYIVMLWKETIDLQELINQGRYSMVVDGHKILLIWHQNQVHAMQSQCPHFKLSLAKGKITEESIVCPFHKSEFDLKSGEVRCWSPWPQAVGRLLGKMSKPKKLKIYPTRIEKGKIEIQLF